MFFPPPGIPLVGNLRTRLLALHVLEAVLPACESGVEDDQMAQVSIFKIIRRHSLTSATWFTQSWNLQSLQLQMCHLFSSIYDFHFWDCFLNFFISKQREREIKLVMRCEKWWYSEYFQGQNERKIYRISYYVWASRERKIWSCMASSEVHIARQQGSWTHSVVG